MERIKKTNPDVRSILVSVMLLFFLWILPETTFAVELERISYEGPVFTIEKESDYPTEFLEDGGKKYQLVSVELKNTEIQGVLTYVSTSIPYELEGDQEPPETAVVTLKDETTGNNYEREVTRKEMIEKELTWNDDFSFPVTVFGYEADVFLLGEHEVPAGADLTEYGDFFLEYLKLPSDCYRIERVDWNGESYEQDGVICRDAIAYGEKLVRYVDVIYGGQVQTPNIPAKQYVAVYEEVPMETEMAETEIAMEVIESDVTEEIEESTVPDESFAEQVMRWVKEHLTVVVFSGLFLLVFLGWILLLYLSGKKKGKAGD